MKFYCKKCQNRFDEDYETLFDIIQCPACNHEDIVLKLIKQGVHPPEKGFGLSYDEFEDALENGKIDYLEVFFEEEFDLKYTRTEEEYSVIGKTGNEIKIKEIYEKTQKDGKLQRIIYNIHYILLQGL
ncbi:MAG: hypothetical protein HGN29_07835 [Asgard group archaeon]|nr:hypothetical protein [Asgard group archaeon]